MSKRMYDLDFFDDDKDDSVACSNTCPISTAQREVAGKRARGRGRGGARGRGASKAVFLHSDDSDADDVVASGVHNQEQHGEFLLYVGRRCDSEKKPSRNLGVPLLNNATKEDMIKRAQQCLIDLKLDGRILLSNNGTNTPYKTFDLQAPPIKINGQLKKMRRQLQQQSLPSVPDWAADRRLPSMLGSSFSSSMGFALCSNASANPMEKRARTEATHLQWKRIPYRVLERSQSALQERTMFLMSSVRGEHPDRFSQVGDLPFSEFGIVPSTTLGTGESAGLLMASTGMYGLAMPTKLSKHNLIDEAYRWATKEMRSPGRYISDMIRVDERPIQKLCRSILGIDCAYNSFWASIALLYYLKQHLLLREHLQLDPLSLDIVDVLSRYACIEHMRRANYDKKLSRDIQNYDDEIAQLSQSIEAYNEDAELLETNDRSASRKQELIERKNEILSNADSARTVRQRNGGVEQQAVSTNESTTGTRTTLGNTPHEVLQRWIAILDGKFTMVLTMIGSSQDIELEYSAIQNVQMQLGRIGASISTEYETMICDVFIRLAKNVTQLMRSLVTNAQLVPKIERDDTEGKLKIVRTDSDGKPLRTVAYNVFSSPFITSPKMNTLWARESFVVSDQFEPDQHPLRILKDYNTVRSSPFVQSSIPSVMSSTQTPTRSFLNFVTRVPKSDELTKNEYLKRCDPSTAETLNSSSNHSYSHAPTGCCSFLSIGLRLAQCIVGIQGTRPRPVRLSLGVSTRYKVSELPLERERISPSPILLVCDAQADFRSAEPEEEEHCVTYQVVGHRATRLVDFFDNSQRILTRPLDAVSTLLIGVVQLAYTTQASVWCMPTSINAPMSNGMQVTRPDYMSVHLTAFELYFAGRNNIYRGMVGTPWESSTSAWVDVGVCTFAMNGVNYNDARNPATFYMSESLLEEYATLFASTFCSQIGIDYYAEKPHALRGIPFGLIPGVHAALDSYYTALKRTHKDIGLRDNDRADLLVFTISPWAQQIGAYTKTSEWQLDHLPGPVADFSRNRVLNPDNTDPRRAIARGERMVEPNLIDPYNQVFNNGIEEIQAVFMLSSVLAVIAKWVATANRAPAPSARLLKNELVKFMAPSSTQTPSDVQRAKSHLLAVALLCLTIIYPHTHANNGDIVHPTLAAILSRCLHEGRSPHSLLQQTDYELLMHWWFKFNYPDKTRCVWDYGIAPIVDLHIAHDGTHDLRERDYAAMHDALDTLIKSSYYFYSNNGTEDIEAPNPLRRVDSPEGVTRDHVDGVFVVRYAHEQETGACGGIVGVKMVHLQQLFSLATMSLKVAPDKLQIRRYVGQMTVRFSSDATDALPTEQTALDTNTRDRPGQAKHRRTERTKQFSCIFSERDELAQGTLEERAKVCADARKAWDFNLRQFLKAFTTVNEPDSPLERMRGDFSSDDTRPTSVHHTKGASSTFANDQYGSVLSALANAAQP